MASEHSQPKHHNTIQLETKSKQRKPTKNATTKKVARRGMGVAQLERLRLQERWKKMTDFNQLESLQLNNNNNTALHLPTTFNYGMFNGVPVQLGFGGFGKDLSYNVTPPLFISPRDVVGGSYGGCVLEESNENNSIVGSNRCDLCFKKKCPDGEREKIMRVSKEVEVIAVHRKGNSGVLMEYEFFSEKRDKGTSSKDMLAATDHSGDTSTSHPSGITDQADYFIHNNSMSPPNVDLSLKL